jgi:8-oxo-dGTP diphosphatase
MFAKRPSAWRPPDCAPSPRAAAICWSSWTTTTSWPPTSWKRLPLQILCLAGYFRALYHLGGVVAQSVGRVYGELRNQTAYAALVIGGGLVGSRFDLAGVAITIAVLAAAAVPWSIDMPQMLREPDFAPLRQRLPSWLESSLNAIAQRAYRSAYLMARAWWFVRRPHTFGSVVAVWCDGRLLLVRTSYRRQYNLPGGFLKPRETALEAAVREVSEELRLALPPGGLTLGWHGSTFFEHRHDTTTIWEIVLDAQPQIHVDGREVVWAGWWTPAEALTLALSPPVRAYLASR